MPSRGEDFALQAVMSDVYLKQIKEEALQQNITTIRNRVNELGVAEPVVQRQGAERIIVELPGVQDTARAQGNLRWQPHRLNSTWSMTKPILMLRNLAVYQRVLKCTSAAKVAL